MSAPALAARVLILEVAGLCALVLSGCANAPGRPLESDTPIVPSQISDFSVLYNQNCAGCHGATGTGQPGVFPPLANNPVVNGPADKVIAIVNGGLTTPITVNGANFSGSMPAWKGNLTPAQIADVLTYVRSAWGNKAGPVTTAQVAAAK